MKFEEYLLHPNRKERIAMAKLRISDHKLMIEVGRHRRPAIAREERLCYMCKDNLEDEIHFLTECNIYGSRNIFWDQVHLKFPQTAELSTKDKFIFIMTQEDPELTNKILKMNHEWMLFRNFLHENFYNQK